MIDLVIGKNHSGALVTRVECKAKYNVCVRINSKLAKAVTKVPIKLLKPFKNMVFTITSNNSKEFFGHTKIVSALNAKFYCADLYSL